MSRTRWFTAGFGVATAICFAAAIHIAKNTGEIRRSECNETVMALYEKQKEAKNLCMEIVDSQEGTIVSMKSIIEIARIAR